MPRQLSTALRALIKADLEAGANIKTLIATHKISEKKARNMRNLHQETGEVWRPTAGIKHGRPKKIQESHEDRLRIYLEENPGAYLKDMCDFLAADQGLDVNEATMWRTCRRMGWELKKQARPRDELGFWVRTLPRDENGKPIRTSRVAKEKYTKRPKGPDQIPSRGLAKKLLGKTHEFVKEYMSQARFDASHDWDHVQRVLALSKEILRVEQNTYRKLPFDATAIELTVLMHDVDDHKYRLPTSNPESQGYPSPDSQLDPYRSNYRNMDQATRMDLDQSTLSNIDPTLSFPPDTTLVPEDTAAVNSVEHHLLQLGWPPVVVTKVATICTAISYTCETQQPQIHAAALAQYPELAIVQDADRLDAIGAIGIGRAFTYGGAKSREGGMNATIAHFKDKLEKLESMMKTGQGKRLAVQRAERLRQFRGWWEEEMRFVGVEMGTGPVPATSRRIQNSVGVQTNEQELERRRRLVEMAETARAAEMAGVETTAEGMAVDARAGNAARQLLEAAGGAGTLGEAGPSGPAERSA